MTRLRRQCAPLVPALTALFALALTAPRPGLVHHVHAGGDHAHTHARPAAGSAPAAHDHHGDHHHADHHHGDHHHGDADHADANHGDGYRRGGAADAAHVHLQHPYDFAVAPALAAATRALPVAAATATVAQRPASRARDAARARGPPAARSA